MSEVCLSDFEELCHPLSMFVSALFLHVSLMVLGPNLIIFFKAILVCWSCLPPVCTTGAVAVFVHSATMAVMVTYCGRLIGIAGVTAPIMLRGGYSTYYNLVFYLDIWIFGNCETKVRIKPSHGSHAY